MELTIDAKPSASRQLVAAIKSGISNLLPERKNIQQASQHFAQFMRDNSAGVLGSWVPALRETSDDVASSWHIAGARAIDAMQNSGILAGAIDQACTDTIGTELKLNAEPDFQMLGWSEDEAAEWATLVEQRFRMWANNPLECDARGKLTLGQMTDTALRWHYSMGEVTALLRKIRRPHSHSMTKIFMVPPHLMPLETNETIGLYQGVFLDGNGFPTGYRFKRKQSYGYETHIDFKARDRYGRTQVIHVFDGLADQVRGMTPLAPILKVFRQADQLADATLMAALIQTIVAATIKSPELSENAMEAFSTPGSDGSSVPDEFKSFMMAKAGWWQNKSIDIGHGARIAHLFPGEEFKIEGAKTPTDNYLPFYKNLMREIARCIGVTYEGATGDFVNATYSSVRMGNSSIWPMALKRRANIAVPFVQRAYENWLFEQVARGFIPFPGGIKEFKKQRHAATRTSWNGPAKPTADDLKTAKAQTERLENYTTSLTRECAENGTDIHTIMRERKRESDLAKSMNLPDPHMQKEPVKAIAAPAENDKDDLDGDGH